MPRVICKLPNASHLINGVRFASLGEGGGGMLSEEIPDHIAESFLAIRGYEPHAMPSEPRGQHEQKARAGTASQKETV